MKQHSMNGAKMLDAIQFFKKEPLMKFAYDICRWHHERWDGRGYPDGLKGNDIPISAQVVSIADVYDALTSERCYKKAFTHEKALEMIRNNECGVFNPLLLECLGDVADRLPQEINDQRTNNLSRTPRVYSLFRPPWLRKNIIPRDWWFQAYSSSDISPRVIMSIDSANSS